MYCTIPSGTRYHVGNPDAVRSRQAVDEIASAGISISVTLSAGRWEMSFSSRSTPGRETPTKWASSNSSSALAAPRRKVKSDRQCSSE